MVEQTHYFKLRLLMQEHMPSVMECCESSDNLNTDSTPTDSSAGSRKEFVGRVESESAMNYLNTESTSESNCSNTTTLEDAACTHNEAAAPTPQCVTLSPPIATALRKTLGPMDDRSEEKLFLRERNSIKVFHSFI